MSRRKNTGRRKNAGKGFGMIFHGAFGSKKDAAAKERHVKGGFIRRTEYPTGARWVVYSRRANPIRRRKRKPEMVKAYAPREYTSHNPMELTVMGANPRRRRRRLQENAQEMVVHPGQTITFRFNPSAETIREEFVGKPVDWITIYHEPHMVAGEYAQLGQVMGINYKPVGGGQVKAIGWYKGADRIPLLEAAKKLLPLTEAPVLVAAKDRHLYLVGGDQDVSPICGQEDMCYLGKVRHIVYRERKGLDEFHGINYANRFGHDPDTGRQTEPPSLVYARRVNRILFEGGDYDISWRGIEN